MENIFSSVKEFIWDIIGYLIPGSLVLLLLNVIFDLTIPSDTGHFLFIIISYIIGYVIYGINIFIYEVCCKISFRDKIEREIKGRLEYTNAIDKINLKLSESFDGDSKVRTIRSIVMSYIPESDTKIYTFTFRSELSSSCSTVCMIFGIIGLASSTLDYLIGDKFDYFLESDYKKIIFYILLIISAIFLRNTRNKFYKMSMSLPFSIFITKDL
ncbi:hypothetical protein [Chryseobacterium caseinilyticum]|uniref:Uncharacterized protein n=1 Tax=Chryseobacterium caseinilyticum TaxID=2771428 RepID=A0ABR8ZDP8_9FLAO|nr:hypothetical protein [Chryseobacterium caseinilyticum]MBD8083020.1 hypothetical protein [Chryseobacterium caseinilyticum]